jgi:tRNA threonylcarbamoyl adenosine modification protein YeaZ
MFPKDHYALALHTSSPDLGLALSNFAGESRCQTWDVGREASNQLQIYLDSFIHPHAWSDCAFVAVCKGPGGFTGTRLGVVTARTLAQQLDIPVFGISSLAAIAWRRHLQRPLKAETRIAIQMPAQRDHVYGAIYAVRPLPEQLEILHLEPSMPDSVFTEAAWAEVLHQWDCAETVVADGPLGESALALLELAYLDWQRGDRPSWADVQPFYGLSPVS